MNTRRIYKLFAGALILIFLCVFIPDSIFSDEPYKGPITTLKLQFEGTRVYKGEITTEKLQINGSRFRKFKLEPLEMTGMGETLDFFKKTKIKIDLGAKKQAEGEIPAGRAIIPGQGESRTQRALPGGAQNLAKQFGAAGGVSDEEIR